MFFFHKNREMEQIANDYEKGAEQYIAFVVAPHTQNHLDIFKKNTSNPILVDCAGVDGCYLEQVNMNLPFIIDRASKVLVRSLNQLLEKRESLRYTMTFSKPFINVLDDGIANYELEGVFSFNDIDHSIL